MDIYLIRHGETDWNKKLLIQGRTDNALNETGRNQAKEVVSKMEDVEATHLYSSPLLRAKETMDILKKGKNWNQEIVLESEFQERDFGEFDGKLFSEYKQAKKFDPNNTFEINEKLEKRVRDALQKIIDSHTKTDKVVVTAHSHVLKAILVSLFPKDYDYEFSLPNCAIVHFKVNSGKLELVEIK